MPGDAIFDNYKRRSRATINELPTFFLSTTVYISALRKLLRNARLVHNTSNRAGSASANGASVRCMDGSSRSSTIAVEAARAAMASQPTWLAAEAFAARALHHTTY